MITLNVKRTDNWWYLDDGDTTIGIVSLGDDGYTAMYMAGCYGDFFEGEELGTFNNGIDALGAIMEKANVTPHCYECQRAYGGVHKVGEHYYCDDHRADNARLNIGLNG